MRKWPMFLEGPELELSVLWGSLVTIHAGQNYGRGNVAIYPHIQVWTGSWD